MASEILPRDALLREPAIRRYMLVCLVGLLVVLVVLLGKGADEWSLAPVVVGLVTLLLHAGWGPSVVLAAVMWLVVAVGRGAEPGSLFRGVIYGRLGGRPPTEAGGWGLDDLLLAAGLLTYLLSFYRIQGLVHHILPVDPRRKRWLRQARADGVAGADRTPIGEKRPLACPHPDEVPWLVGLGLGWALMAWILWGLITLLPPGLGFDVTAWRGLVVFWLAALGLAASIAVLAYLRQATADPETAQIYLQDQLWQETRREQSRLNRWLVWARLRAQRRQEKRQ